MRFFITLSILFISCGPENEINEIVKQDAPEILDTFIENTAAKMELTVDYFVQEFLPSTKESI